MSLDTPWPSLRFVSYINDSDIFTLRAFFPRMKMEILDTGHWGAQLLVAYPTIMLTHNFTF